MSLTSQTIRCTSLDRKRVLRKIGLLRNQYEFGQLSQESTKPEQCCSYK